VVVIDLGQRALNFDAVLSGSVSASVCVCVDREPLGLWQVVASGLGLVSTTLWECFFVDG